MKSAAGPVTRRESVFAKLIRRTCDPAVTGDPSAFGCACAKDATIVPIFDMTISDWVTA